MYEQNISFFNFTQPYETKLKKLFFSTCLLPSIGSYHQDEHDNAKKLVHHKTVEDAVQNQPELTSSSKIYSPDAYICKNTLKTQFGSLQSTRNLPKYSKSLRSIIKPLFCSRKNHISKCLLRRHTLCWVHSTKTDQQEKGIGCDSRAHSVTD